MVQNRTNLAYTRVDSSTKLKKGEKMSCDRIAQNAPSVIVLHSSLHSIDAPRKHHFFIARLTSLLLERHMNRMKPSRDLLEKDLKAVSRRFR